MWHSLDALGPWLAGLAMVGGPVLLAWWLSDGFAGDVQPEAFEVDYRAAYNPHTGQSGLTAVHIQTGVQQAWTS